MKPKRRTVLKGGVAIAAATLLPPSAQSNTAKPGGSLDQPTHDLNEELVGHFSELGYELLEPASIVTGDEAFNGGLRYDETGLHEKRGQMTIQACARVEDIRNKDHTDVLPLFHLFYCITPADLKSDDTFAQLLDYLTNRAKLDAGRFSFVTVPEFEPHLPTLERFDFDSSRQIHFRNSEQAKKDGDGSGFFRFPGDPNAEAFATVGIYYWTGGGTPPKLAEYPPQTGWTEIGEASIDDEADFAFGLGTERLGLAMNGNIPSWQERLTLLFEEIELASAGNPPPGKAEFANG
ncbi:MAG: hypothetical protein AAGC96_12900 [Pseudomonadota bacterium]